MKYRSTAGLIALVACQAHAEIATPELSPWTVRAAAGLIRFHSDTSAEMPRGQTVPGARVDVDNNTSVGLDVAYQIAPRWQSLFALGRPPTTTLHAAGVLGAYVQPNGPLTGVLGKIKYAPLMWTVIYSPGSVGPVEPYVGAGVNYTRTVSTRDGDTAGLSVDNAWGSVIQAGFNLPVDRRWSVFLDARKVFVKTKATGYVPALGAMPVGLTMRLDPLMVSAGISYRF
ncbi:OmpW/AlkL family protein [Rugamonas apoptosis]|uniref:OmpW family protein n=1 Tax=Rugamonas apoptosis TaxID=2758570 RepID=A0A7W2F7P6_9BURK|nr:OmpW family outer membrane protein [Rugamonas apoptosis]MBA5686666.1 OmpW family protein [Rugamonas apoptosis]